MEPVGDDGRLNDSPSRVACRTRLAARGQVTPITPVVVFLLDTIGTALLVRTWVRRRRNTVTTPEGIPVQLPENDAVRERIRRETEY